MGRPKKEFDLEQVRLMGQFKATYATIADWFRCSTKTVERAMKDESEFCLSYKKGFADTKLKLSEAQIKYALNGSAPLLIWLGKQYLGQKDPDKSVVDEVNETELFEKLKEVL
jgi:hypothetical protein